MQTTKEQRINREYTRDFLLAMVAYVVVLVASIWGTQQVDAQWAKWLIAVLPVFPVAFALRAFLRYLSQIDEFQQHLQLQAIGFAAGAAGITTFTLGLLENVDFPHLPLVWVMPLLIAFWGIATCWLHWRSR